MNESTKQQLLELIREKGPIGPTKLANRLQISSQMVHRHLKALLGAEEIQKIGAPPKVFYIAAEKKIAFDFPKLDAKQEKYINAHYLAVKPDGKILEGLLGFQWWAKKTKQHKNFRALANEYINDHNKYKQQNIGLWTTRLPWFQCQR